MSVDTLSPMPLSHRPGSQGPCSWRQRCEQWLLAWWGVADPTKAPTATSCPQPRGRRGSIAHKVPHSLAIGLGMDLFQPPYHPWPRELGVSLMPGEASTVWPPRRQLPANRVWFSDGLFSTAHSGQHGHCGHLCLRLASQNSLAPPEWSPPPT